MLKDFDDWNEKKKRIDGGHHKPFFSAREIWWCYLGLNVGSEHNGSGRRYSRPVLILKGLSRTTCIIIPLTTAFKTHPYHIPLGTVDGKKAHAVISQIRVIDTKRFINRISVLHKDIFEHVRKSVTGLL